MDDYAPENEQCDDGNLANNDGCTKYCQITPGWFCPWPSQSCYLVCPDGILNNIPGKPDNWYAYNTEICDEGTHPTAGCTNYCTQITNGWECPVVGQSCRTICGNNILDPSTTPRIAYIEQCDLGTASNNGAAGCSSTCQVVRHWECPSPTVSCRLLCGNGNWDMVASGAPGGQHSEACDDGNVAPGDGCDANCNWETYDRTLDFGYREYYISNEIQYNTWHGNYKDACINLYATHSTGNSTLPGFLYPNLLSFAFFEVYPSSKMFCHTGVYCDDCIKARWPGYPIIHKAPNPNEMAYQAHPSRGRFFFIEDPTSGGFAASFIYNDKTFYWQYQTANKFPTMYQHNGIGSVRLSVGKYYFENNGERGLIIKRLSVTAGASTLVDVCKVEATESDFGLPPLQGSDFFIWWPNYNLLLARQFNGRQMDILKFAASFSSSNNNISCKVSDLMGVKYYFSDIPGELNLYPVFMKDPTGAFTKMLLYRKTTSNKGVVSYLVSIYEWYPETGVIYEEGLVDIEEEVWDMVAFDTAVLLVTPTKTYSITYNSATKLYVRTQVTPTIQSGTTGKKWRFFQKRPDPDLPSVNPPVYGYYIEEDYHKNLFHVTTYASSTFTVSDNTVYTLPIRYHSGGTPGLDQWNHNLNEGYLLILMLDQSIWQYCNSIIALMISPLINLIFGKTFHWESLILKRRRL